MSDAFSSVTAGLGLGGGPSIPGAPALARPRTIINEIFGTTTKEVKVPGEKGRRIVTSLNLSPEEQERLDTIEAGFDNFLGQLSSLTELTAAIESETFSPVINAVRSQQQEAREGAFRERSRLEEEVLSRRGISDSTSATEARSQRGDALQDQIVSDERDLTLLAEDLREQAFNRAGQTFSIFNQALNEDRNFRAQGSAQNTAQQSNLFNLDNSILTGQFNNRLQSAGAQAGQQQQIFSNLTSLAGGAGFFSGGSNLQWGSNSGSLNPGESIIWN